jgi:hypothetical protein
MTAPYQEPARSCRERVQNTEDWTDGKPSTFAVHRPARLWDAVSRERPSQLLGCLNPWSGLSADRGAVLALSGRPAAGSLETQEGGYVDS